MTASSERLSVAVASGHRLLREALCAALQQQSHLRLVRCEVESAGSLRELIAREKPHVVLLLAKPAVAETLQVVRQVCSNGLAARMLLVGSDLKASVLLEAVKSGLRGYISEDAGIPELLQAMEAIYAGELWIERKLLTTIVDSRLTGDPERPEDVDPIDHLTPRERQVLARLPRGDTNRQIARRLCISEKTVKVHLNRIFKKIGVERRVQAAVFAIQADLDDR